MTKLEWEILRKLERRTRFMAAEVHTLKEQNVRVQKLEDTLTDFSESMRELERILKFRKTVKRILIWVLAIVVSATLTTFVNYKTQMYIQPDIHRKVNGREDSKDVTMG